MENATNNTSGFDFVQFLKDNAIKIVAVVFWLAIIGAAVAYQQSSELSPAGIAENLQAAIAGTWWGPFVYTFIYFLRPVILFPASILTILAGNLYGLAIGWGMAVIAGSVSAIIPYFAGRWIFGNATEAAEDNEKIKQLQKFADGLRNNPFQTVITMRLLFLPYDAVSIFVGSLRIPFIPFFVATALGNIPGALPYVLLGASVEGNPFAGDVSLDWRVFVLAAVMFVLSIGGSQLFKRIRARRTGEAETTQTLETNV